MPDGQLSTGDAQQIRIIAEAFAESIVSRFPASPPSEKMEIPAPMKWAAGIVSALITALVVTGVLWLVSTVNSMQGTLIRIDERQQASAGSLDSRFAEQDRRILQLESYHRRVGE